MSNSNFLPKCIRKLNRAAWQAALPASLILAAGCAGPTTEKPTQPAAPPGVASVPPATNAAAKPAAAPPPEAVAAALAAADAKVDLPAGAAAEPAPFEGEGWEALFDGKTLAG